MATIQGQQDHYLSIFIHRRLTMIRALKVTMIVYAASGILFGMAFVFVPRQLGAMLGHEAGPPYVAALTAELGVSFISACIFLIIVGVASGISPLLYASSAFSTDPYSSNIC